MILNHYSLYHDEMLQMIVGAMSAAIFRVPGFRSHEAKGSAEIQESRLNITYPF